MRCCTRDHLGLNDTRPRRQQRRRTICSTTRAARRLHDGHERRTDSGGLCRIEPKCRRQLLTTRERQTRQRLQRPTKQRLHGQRPHDRGNDRGNGLATTRPRETTSQRAIETTTKHGQRDARTSTSSTSTTFYGNNATTASNSVTTADSTATTHRAPRLRRSSARRRRYNIYMISHGRSV